jgi:hypothetical protein
LHTHSFQNYFNKKGNADTAAPQGNQFRHQDTKGFIECRSIADTFSNLICIEYAFVFPENPGREPTRNQSLEEEFQLLVDIRQKKPTAGIVPAWRTQNLI